jgi:hypothetical protein
MGDAVLPVIADEDLVRHVVEVHCSRFGCGHLHVLDDADPWSKAVVRPVDWVGVHESDHRLQFTDGTSPFGHVHIQRVAA